jgi:hypothetical protein
MQKSKNKNVANPFVENQVKNLAVAIVPSCFFQSPRFQNGSGASCPIFKFFNLIKKSIVTQGSRLYKYFPGLLYINGKTMSPKFRSLACPPPPPGREIVFFQ